MSEPAPGRPEITLVRAPNPGPMTLSGTNTYVVAGSERAYVIDPGPDDAGHLDAVREAAAQWGGVAGVLITHSHLDHTAGVAALGAPVLYGKVGDGEEGAAMMKVSRPASGRRTRFSRPSRRRRAPSPGSRSSRLPATPPTTSASSTATSASAAT